jgi:hypothetical protein
MPLYEDMLRIKNIPITNFKLRTLVWVLCRYWI